MTRSIGQPMRWESEETSRGKVKFAGKKGESVQGTINWVLKDVIFHYETVRARRSYGSYCSVPLRCSRKEEGSFMHQKEVESAKKEVSRS
jgi:hypothetical protein